jgi:hypothetical protein
LAFSYSYLFSCSRKYTVSGKLASKISLFDRIDVKMGAALPHSYEFNLEALVERIMEKGNIAFRVCSGHWLMNYINLLKLGRRD